MNWIINLLSGQKKQTLRVGSVVRTRLGLGVVVGGTIHIKYNDQIVVDQPKNRTWTHNINEITEA